MSIKKIKELKKQIMELGQEIGKLDYKMVLLMRTELKKRKFGRVKSLGKTMKSECELGEDIIKMFYHNLDLKIIPKLKDKLLSINPVGIYHTGMAFSVCNLVLTHLEEITPEFFEKLMKKREVEK